MKTNSDVNAKLRMEKCFPNGSTKYMYSLFADQCRFGPVAEGRGGTGPAMKPTGFLTNSLCIARGLERRCPNGRHGSRQMYVGAGAAPPLGAGVKLLEHVHPMNGRTMAAEVYPDQLRRAFCSGLAKQILTNEQDRFWLSRLAGHHEDSPAGELS